jgi:hypothetical protein
MPAGEHSARISAGSHHHAYANVMKQRMCRCP